MRMNITETLRLIESMDSVQYALERLASRLGRKPNRTVGFWIAENGIHEIMAHGVHEDYAFGHPALAREDDPDQDSWQYEGLPWSRRALEAGWIRITTNGKELNAEVVDVPGARKNAKILVQFLKAMDSLQAVHVEAWTPELIANWDGQGAPAKQLAFDPKGAVRFFMSF